MGSREKDQTSSHHQPLLSSLVVRPSDSDIADGVGGGGGGGRGGSDYEPGEVRRDPPPYSRSDRYSDEPGYRIRVGSTSPLRRRDADRRYRSDFDHFDGPTRRRDFGSRRDSGRFRDPSPPYSRGRGGGRPYDRGFDRPRFGPGPLRGEGMGRNNPNVRPREGDWICSDPLCANLNFARREFCNNCKRPRFGPRSSPPRRGYPGPPSHAPPRRAAAPLNLSPGRPMNGYRSPPRGWARDGQREPGGPGVPPPPLHGGRFPDPEMRRDRPDYLDDDYRGRSRFDRPMPTDWGHRDHGRDRFLEDRKVFDRRMASPPVPTHALPPPDRWAREELRERSRSPIRGAPLAKEYRRDVYAERGRDDRRGVERDRMGNVY